MLYRFFVFKEGMNYAPVFTALLGSMDSALNGTTKIGGVFEALRTQFRFPVDANSWQLLRASMIFVIPLSPIRNRN